MIRCARLSRVFYFAGETQSPTTPAPSTLPCINPKAQKQGLLPRKSRNVCTIRPTMMRRHACYIPACATGRLRKGVSECSCKSIQRVFDPRPASHCGRMLSQEPTSILFRLLWHVYAISQKPYLAKATSLTISSTHLRSNSTSPKRFADCLARKRTARGSGRERAFSKPSANSSAVDAWNPGNFS